MSLRSYTASNNDETGLKDKDFKTAIYEANTMDTLLLFTSLGNFLYVPVYELPDLKWKDMGKHISNIIKISSDEDIISSYLTKDFKENVNFLSFTKNGMVKQTNINDLKVPNKRSEVIDLFFKWKTTIEKLDTELDYYENNLENMYRNNELSYTDFRKYDNDIENIENILDKAEDTLELKTNYDD